MKKLMMVEDVADYARCSRRTLYRAVATGRLRSGRKGRHLVFDEGDVEAWLFAPAAPALTGSATNSTQDGKQPMQDGNTDRKED